MSSIGQGSISIDDSTRIGENAQDTANKVAGNINDINSDNKLTPSEKIKLKQEYDKDLKLYTIDVSQLQSADLPTTELETAMGNLTAFITPLFKEMNSTSNVDRNALDGVFTAFATADKNASQAFVNKVQQVADGAKEAGDDAKTAASQAQAASEEAKNSAQQALGNITVVDSKVTKLSASTTAQFNTLNNGYQEVITTVNDMDIGAVNLIKGSNNDIVIDDTSDNNGWKYQAVYYNLVEGQQYTFSSEVTVNVGKADNICINVYNPNNGATTLISNRPIVNGKIEYTFTAVKDYPSLLVYAGLKGGTQGNKVTLHHYQLEKGNKATDWAPAPEDFASQTDITASIGNIHLGVKNADGSSSIFNMNGNTILMDTAQTIISGKTSILDGTIGTAKIANAAINDAKISNLNGNKLVENSITANKINVDDLIANGINTKTLTSVNLNTSTLTTPQLNLGLNGTFTEDFDYTQATSMFLPKKNKGTLTFDHGSLQSKGNMQTYVGGKWGGMNDNYTFQAGIDNSQWTEVAPGYIKLDLFKQNDADVGQRTYIDPTGYYYTSRNGIASYLGNVLQVPQVQTSSVLAKYVGPTDGKSLLQIGSNGSHYGLQVGPYAGNEAVLSDFIYNSTTSGAPNVNITENGHLVRSTSASKYKYNIKNPDIETTLGDRLLNVHLATWNDKRAVDLYAEQLSTGEEREKTSIDKYYGLIAEQLRDAGLDMFINYGKNHEIEGIQYDRAWVPLLSVIRRLNNKVNEYELRLSKLEGGK